MAAVLQSKAEDVTDFNLIKFILCILAMHLKQIYNFLNEVSVLATIMKTISNTRHKI